MMMKNNMANQEYEALFKQFKSLWWLTDPFGMFIYRHVEGKFQPMFQHEVEQTYFQLFPKRKKFKLADIPVETVAAIKDKWQKQGLEWLEQQKEVYQQTAVKMAEIAKDYQVVDSETEQMVYGQQIYTYNSQPGKWTYALGDAKKRQNLLTQTGFTSRIVKTIDGYELWAKLTMADLDILERQNQKTVFDLALECWQNGQNPKVLYPFLSDDIYEKSRAAYMQPSVGISGKMK